MTKEQIAAVLDEIGMILEIRGEDRFRSLAYQRAARAIEQVEESLADLVQNGRLRDIRDIGKTIAEAIMTLYQTGHLPYHERLRAETPPGLFHMLRLPGMGPKKVKLLYDQLGVDDLQKLRAACVDGRVAAIKGFGPKTQEKLLQGIEFLDQVGQRLRIDQVEGIAQRMIDRLQACPDAIRVAVCGSLRRRRETIHDIDLLVSARDPAPIMDCFVASPEVAEVTGRGDTKCSVTLRHATSSGRRLLVQADLRVVQDEQFAFALHYFTGNKDHNIAMRGRAQDRGLKLNEYGFTGGDHACATEEQIFETLGLAYIAPELREHTGEMEAASEHRLPRLLEASDIRGVFHCHSDWSDGAATMKEMALVARDLGYEYFGVADHSQGLTIARGLSPERVKGQQAEIDQLNEELKGIHLFKGTECDILPDGSLDFDDVTLDTFDYVVASIHSNFAMSEQEMTARIIRAIRNPRVTMLGHPTGRLLLRRKGYTVDLEAVLQAAAESGTLIEINAQPTRLDLDWVHCKRARALGVQLVINPDGHSTDELKFVRYGVDVARRGWLEKRDVFNTLSKHEVVAALAARKARIHQGG